MARRPRRADLTNLPTATSRAPCPFCRGRRWVRWWVGALCSSGEGHTQQSGRPVVDEPVVLFDGRSLSADECSGCGAVVSGPVEVC